MRIHKNHLSKQKSFKRQNYFQIKTFGKIVSKILKINMNNLIYLIMKYFRQAYHKLIVKKLKINKKF